MLKSFTVINAANDSLEVLMGNEAINPLYRIKEIEGLGPVKATINTIGSATLDGEIFNSAKIGVRNIVMDLKYVPRSMSIEAARRNLYRYFPVGGRVTLRFYTDDVSVEIVGHVEAHDPTIFSREAGARISIICPDGRFRDTGAIKEVFFTRNTPANIDYPGDVPTGFEVYVRKTNATAMTQFVMTKDGASGSVIYTGTIANGVTLAISTIKGRKTASLLNTGTSPNPNVFNSLNTNINWLQIVRGINRFTLRQDPTGAGVVMSIRYYVYRSGI